MPYTEDEVYWHAFSAIVPPLIARFAPDVLVTQLGTDTHYRDPLTHMQLSTAGYAAVVQAFRDMGLPWLATGGGGYHVGTVARIWTVAYGLMSDQAFSDEIPAGFATQYGIGRLNDQEKPQLSRQHQALSREHAEIQVAELQRLLRR